MTKKTIANIVKILFAVYCLALIYILFVYDARQGNQFNLAVFSKEHIEMVNLIPFKTIIDFIDKLNNSSINASIVIRNMSANLLMFIPMGMALPVLFPKKFNRLWKVLVLTACLVLLIEIIQFLTFCGSADIDDLILNTVSCAIGYGIIQIGFIRKLLKLQ